MSEPTTGKQPREQGPSDHGGDHGDDRGKGSTTPGRPTDSNSRQQTHANQNSQSGSPALDKEHTRSSGGDDKAPKPPNAK